ncbi:exo-alpha-sialidase [Sedimentisphaera salicampi]|uniref:exo-alpha-sialidase n=1 Tax=Sedimentisphaera salicampi TaxID=1941349 RepID=UPI000B9A2800|nr:exo-alpha-sialidase [Sedimentisphaera salicampi]OXU15690.1 Sialidase A precursor [Sedimentisphaera salicampi]
MLACIYRVSIVLLLSSRLFSYTILNPNQDKLPLEFTDQAQQEELNFEINSLDQNMNYIVVIETVDINNFDELGLKINGIAVTPPPELFAATGKQRGFVRIKDELVTGDNRLQFIFSNSRNGSDKGFLVTMAQIWIGQQDELIEEYDEKYFDLYSNRLYYRKEEPVFNKVYTFDNMLNFKDTGWQNISGINTVVSSGSNKYLQLYSINNPSEVKINCFSRDTVLEGRFNILYSAPHSHFEISLRHNIDSNDVYKVSLIYDTSEKRWELIDGWLKEKLRNGSSLDIQPNQWYNFKVVIDKVSISFYINGNLVLKSKSIRNTNYGGIVFGASGAIVNIDDLSYEGNDKHLKNYKMFCFENSAMGDMTRVNNELILHEGSSYLSSDDEGLTWNETDIFDALGSTSSKNILSLNSGRLLAMFNVIQPNNLRKLGVKISNDQGSSWSDMIWVNQTPQEHRTMNSKISQISNGRIFIPTGSEFGEADGGVVTYYSDDDGLTWTRSNVLDRSTTNGFNLQEAQVVELGNGDVRLIARSDMGRLLYADSPDGGATWSTDINIMPIISPMNAFNVRRDDNTNEIFLFWTYSDPDAWPHPALPRERLALAKTENDMETWQYLMTVDDFQGLPWRFNDLGMYVDENYIFPMVNLMIGDRWRRPKDLMVYRVPREELEGFEKFPPLRNNRYSKVLFMYDFEEFDLDQNIKAAPYKVNDKKGMGFHGRTEGELGFAEGSSSSSGSVALHLNGNGNGIVIRNDDFDTRGTLLNYFNIESESPFFISAVFRTNNHSSGGTDNSGALVARDVGPGESSWWTRIRNGVLQFFVSDTDGNTVKVEGTTNVSDNKWHEVVFAKDIADDKFVIILDGKLEAQQDNTLKSDVELNANVAIGHFNEDNRIFQGYIDEVLVSKADYKNYISLYSGDLNKDGIVDIRDLVIMTSNWGD